MSKVRRVYKGDLDPDGVIQMAEEPNIGEQKHFSYEIEKRPSEEQDPYFRMLDDPNNNFYQPTKQQLVVMEENRIKALARKRQREEEQSIKSNENYKVVDECMD